jgi:polyisoprenoid-binding protein YceI
MSKTKWVMDAAHSEMQFKIKHLMITNITGQFTKFEGTIETEGEDFTTARAHVSADISSISTNNAQRDGHLQSGDFFDTANHPQLTFESEKMEKVDEENYKLHGTLTMRGVTKKVILDAELGGIVKDPRGNIKAGFTITGKINRKDFGVSFGALTETGGLALGEEVKLNVSAQFTKEVAVAV